MKRLRHSQSSAKKEDYRKELFPIFHVEKENVSSVSLQDIYITPEELLLTAEQRTELLSAYEKDVLNTDIRKLGSEVPIGEFSLTIRHVPNKETNTNQPFHSWVNGTREWNAAVNTAFPVTSSEDETNYKTFRSDHCTFTKTMKIHFPVLKNTDTK